jgi:hypothetical protein
MAKIFIDIFIFTYLIYNILISKLKTIFYYRYLIAKFMEIQKEKAKNVLGKNSIQLKNFKLF